jgi:cold shock CspA family protein
MAKSQETWNKKELEKKRKKKQEEKAQRKEERKSSASSGDLDSMLAYVDEYGNITSTPPDPNKKKTVINAEQIQVDVPRRTHEETASNMHSNSVTYFNHAKNFGFIEDETTRERIFTHINGHADTIDEGDKVTFKVEQGPKGLSAFDVKKKA